MPIPYNNSGGVGSAVQAAYGFQPAPVNTVQGPPTAWYNPDTGQPVAPGTPGAKSVITQPSVGNFGNNQTYGQWNQRQNERFSISNDVNYGNYQALGTQAQNAALYGQNVLNDPNAAAALQAQSTQASGPSTQQFAATQNQNRAIANLANAAAGNGPTAADIQSQRSIGEAMRAQLTAGASARGGAYAQSAAQQTAAAQAAGIQAQGVGQAAALRAQEQQAAQQAYAGASGQAVSGANQAFAAQSQALGAATGAAQSEQGMGLNYYNQLANLYNQQSNTAGNLASNQVANDYGLAGTQLTTGTQQAIANQNNSTQLAGAGAGVATGLLVGLASLSTGGAQAAAEGARAGGAPPELAAGIGASIGQRLGELRAGPAAVRYAPADAAAARKGAGFPEANALPGPATEPAAPVAYEAGMQEAHVRQALEHLARLRGARHARR